VAGVSCISRRRRGREVGGGGAGRKEKDDEEDVRLEGEVDRSSRPSITLPASDYRSDTFRVTPIPLRPAAPRPARRRSLVDGIARALLPLLVVLSLSTVSRETDFHPPDRPTNQPTDRPTDRSTTPSKTRKQRRRRGREEEQRRRRRRRRWRRRRRRRRRRAEAAVEAQAGV